MKNRKIKKNMILYGGSFLCVCAILVIAFMIMKVDPFGNMSLANYDGIIQYLDFFAWLKDLLEGKSSITYTFSKTLGGTGMAVFSYYLTSPLNLLIVFFKKQQLNTFFDVLVVLKLGLSALTCSVWLNKRFEHKLERKWIFLLAVGYGLCQYNLAQSSNIMWLDGVILLPLILLGIYREIWKKNWWYLSIFVSVSIFANWYVGCINCLFTVIWALAEMLLYVEENKVRSIVTWIKKVFAYAISMLTGLLLSAVLFLPSIKTLQGQRSNFDRQWLTKDFVGNILTIFPGLTVGAESGFNRNGYVALFCGSIALVGSIGCFISKNIRKTQKVILGMILIISALLFYWQPFIWLFSLVRIVSSYWYRYSYVGVIGIIFCAAYFFLHMDKETAKRKTALLIGTAISAVCMVTVNYIYKQQNMKYVIFSVVVMIILTILILVLRKDKKGISVKSNIIASLLCVVAVAECGTNSALLVKKYEYQNSVDKYSAYMKDEEALIEKIQENDPDYYRITQLKNRLVYDNNTTSAYNEALALGYWSLSGYTSAVDMKQVEMLQRLGYRLNDNVYNIVNTSILSTDSLLGVKYVLADREICGLEKADEYGTCNGKQVYVNPYSLPMVFKYAGSEVNPEDAGNTFLYQNEIYSKLLQEKVQLYVPIKYTESDNQTEIIYTLEVPEGKYSLYGNLSWKTQYTGVLNVNDQYSTAYAKWISPSVFDIPVESDQKTVQVTISSEQAVENTDVQFYALDLNVLKRVTEKLRTQSVENLELQDGYGKIETDGKSGESVFTSVPVDSGWDVTLNGKPVSPVLFSGSIMTIPLQDGENIIEMKYHIPGVKQGVVLSIVGVVLLIGQLLYRNRRRN